MARRASLSETCKLNAVERHAQLHAALIAIANRHPAPRIDDLMPWACQKQSS
jgi:transposase